MRCGRRMLGDDRFGPDKWRTDRWLKGVEGERRALVTAAERSSRDTERSTSVPNPRGGRWLDDTTDPPRTCSHCGGIHPEDAIKLIEAGWEVDPTGKRYKRYLTPPGSKARRREVVRALKAREEVGSHWLGAHWHPTPPVKLYTQHFDEDQAKRFNKALKENG